MVLASILFKMLRRVDGRYACGVNSMAGSKSPGGEAKASEEGGRVAGIVLTGGSGGLLGDRLLGEGASKVTVAPARDRQSRIGATTPSSFEVSGTTRSPSTRACPLEARAQQVGIARPVGGPRRALPSIGLPQ